MLRVRGEDVVVREIAAEEFDGVDVAMFDVPDEVSAQWAPIAAAHGAVAVDNSVPSGWIPTCHWSCPRSTPTRRGTAPRASSPTRTAPTLSMIVVLGAWIVPTVCSGIVVASYQAASGPARRHRHLRDQIAAVASTDVGDRPGTFEPPSRIWGRSPRRSP